MTPLEATEAICLAAATGVALMSGPPTLILEAERGKPAAGTSWIRVTVRDLPTPPMSHGPTGARCATRGGTVIGQCFAPIGTTDGVAAAMTMAQGFRAIFAGSLTAVGTEPLTVEFLTADIRRVGIDKGGWYQVNAEIPFTFDEII